MPRLLIEARRQIVSLYSSKHSVPSIVEQLEQKQVAVSKHAVYHLVKKFRLKGIAKDLPKQKKAKILTNAWLYHMCGYIICVAIPRFHAWNTVNYTRRACSTPRKNVVHTNT